MRIILKLFNTLKIIENKDFDKPIAIVANSIKGKVFRLWKIKYLGIMEELKEIIMKKRGRIARLYGGSEVMKKEMRDAFFEPLVDAALENRNIIILAADHTAFSLNKLIDQAPEQFINVGISEQNMISVAAGMAISGKKVFAYGITPFVSLKVLEQFTLDVATSNLDVNIISVGAGFAYCTDGPSHHGMQDINCMLGVPNISVYNCSDPVNSELIANKALTDSGPTYIRIEKGMMDTIRENNYKFKGCTSF